MRSRSMISCTKFADIRSESSIAVTRDSQSPTSESLPVVDRFYPTDSCGKGRPPPAAERFARPAGLRKRSLSHAGTEGTVKNLLIALLLLLAAAVGVTVFWTLQAGVSARREPNAI